MRYAREFWNALTIGLVSIFCIGAAAPEDGPPYPKQVVHGYDYASPRVPRGDWKQCQQICNRNGACKIWSLMSNPGEPDSLCYLKHTTGPFVPWATIDSGVRTASVSLAAGAPEQGYGFEGGDFRDFTTRLHDWRACAKACDEDGSCKAWSLYTPMGSSQSGCWLKNAIGPLKPALDTVSGRKSQTAAMAQALPPAAAQPVQAVDQSMPPGWENWEKQCAAGDAEACTNFGERLRLGIRTPIDMPRAVQMFRKGCAAKIDVACENGGILIWNGRFGVTENVPEAMAMLNTGCDAGSWRACSVLGRIYTKDQKGIAPDIAKRQAYELRACQNGSALDCAVSALDQTDIQKTMVLLARGCDLGDALSCHSAGIRLNAGKELPANPAFARRLFQRGCDLGQKKGYFDACADLLRLDDPQASQPGAVEKIEGFCNSGAPWSCSWAAQLSINRKDYRAALAWLGKACKGEIAEACRAEKEFASFLPKYEQWQDQEKALTDREREREARINGLLAAGQAVDAVAVAIREYGSPELVDRALTGAGSAVSQLDNFTFDILIMPGWLDRMSPSGRAIVNREYQRRGLHLARNYSTITNTRDVPARPTRGNNFSMFDFDLAPSASNAQKAAYHQKEAEMCRLYGGC